MNDKEFCGDVLKR